MNTDSEKHSFRSILSVFVCVHLWFLAPAFAQQNRWTLTTADFQARQVDLVAIDDAGVRALEKADQPPQQYKWESLLALDRPLDFNAKVAKFVLTLTSGDRVRGEPAKIDGETFTFNASDLGSMSIPLRQVVSIARWMPNPPASHETLTEDLVILTNGDNVRGIVSGLADKQLTVQVSGTATLVPLDSIATILFATTAAAPAKQSHAFRVKLADDSLVTAQSIKTIDDGQLALKLATGDATVPLATVASIEQLNGPVSWLSSRPPSQSIQTPMLQTSRPAKMDRSVTNHPIRFGDRIYAHGIGVAPYSKITWTLDPQQGYQAFRTRYAIDGLSPYADVTLRVYIDGKPVHEKKNFTAGQLSPVILVPLSNAKSLTFEVDFGANYNVQDHLNWIEPALLKSMPLAPTTRP